MVHDPTTEFLQDAIDVALRRVRGTHDTMLLSERRVRTCITANHDFAEWSRHGLFKTVRGNNFSATDERTETGVLSSEIGVT